MTQLKVLEALLTQAPKETFASVAKRAGVTRITVYRFLKDPVFLARYREECQAMLQSFRVQASRALVNGALREGAGQPAMLKMYFNMLGELKDRMGVELTGKDGGPIEVTTPIPFDKLSLETRVRVVEELERLGIGSNDPGVKSIGSGTVETGPGQTIDVRPTTATTTTDTGTRLEVAFPPVPERPTRRRS